LHTNVHTLVGPVGRPLPSPGYHVLEVLLQGLEVVRSDDHRGVTEPSGNDVIGLLLDPIGHTESPKVLEQPPPRLVPGPMTPTGPAPRSSRVAGWRRSWTCRSFRPRRTSSPWLSLRATRSKGCGSGPRVGACRRIGQACIRGRKGRVADGAVGCGEWCERIEAGRGNTKGSRPVMATCSPRVGITLAGARQARFRRRHIEKPPQAIPARAMA
jgi:hypothetical protein